MPDRLPPGQRLAVCDLGSNSFRMVVFATAGGYWRRVDEIYEPVRIGEAMGTEQELRDEPIKRALNTLDVFSHFAAASDLDEESVVAAAADR